MATGGRNFETHGSPPPDMPHSGSAFVSSARLQIVEQVPGEQVE